MAVFDKKYNKKVIYVCFGIAVLFLFAGIFLRYHRKQPLDFSTELWMSEDDTERYRMLADLFRDYDLVGMSANDVQILLGEYSVRRDAFLSDSGEVDYYWGYIIRHDAWKGLEVLLIGLRDNKVVNYERAYLSEL